ncbi:MAG: hypothetical protein IJ428_03665 [Clostridia bacterium]|nr:hypothetical protein [Clostridia bacterium]
MSILKELWNGNISPIEHNPYRSNEYRQLGKEINTAQEILFDGLSEEKRNQYEECVSMIFKRFAVIEEEIFVDAFSLGARMMTEVLGDER